jgi:hypothetical protein
MVTCQRLKLQHVEYFERLGFVGGEGVAFLSDRVDAWGRHLLKEMTFNKSIYVY